MSRTGRGRVPFLIFCLLAAAGFAALGVWQIERRAWKLDLIARVDARIAAAPVAIPAADAWSRLDVRSEEYRRVRVTGRYMPNRNTMVDALTERGAGSWVLSPLDTGHGVVTINRGFVPADGPAAVPVPAGVTTVTGLLRPSEPDGRFLRPNRPGEGRWFSRDVSAIARARGLGPVAPFFIDAAAGPDPNALPIGGMTVIRFRNMHLSYALTWFALAAMALAGAALIWRGRAGRDDVT